mgnify:CR=1 FL=1
MTRYAEVTHLEWIASLPWNHATAQGVDLARAAGDGLVKAKGGAGAGRVGDHEERRLAGVGRDGLELGGRADLLEHARDAHIRAVANRIDIDLDRPLNDAEQALLDDMWADVDERLVEEG